MSSDLREIAAEIRYHHRQRQYAMETRKALDMRLGWYVKTQLGWSKKLPQAQRDAIARNAEDIVGAAKKIEKGKPVETPERFAEFKDIVSASLAARAPFDAIEKTAIKHMERLAMTLPVWPWADEIRGFGPASLAAIVAESGMVSCDKHAPPQDGNYPNPAKLWKRLCVAVMDGTRQGGLEKTAAKTDWIAHGYSGKRRAVMWNIGHSLVLGNGDGEYRAIYLARKQYERDTAQAAGLKVAASADIPKGKQDEYRSFGHIDRRAQRYMEKRLLRNLWRAWRKATKGMQTEGHMPSADDTRDAA